jgi:hypothetical protein
MERPYVAEVLTARFRFRLLERQQFSGRDDKLGEATVQTDQDALANINRGYAEAT